MFAPSEKEQRVFHVILTTPAAATAAAAYVLSRFSLSTTAKPPTHTLD